MNNKQIEFTIKTTENTSSSVKTFRSIWHRRLFMFRLFNVWRCISICLRLCSAIDTTSSYSACIRISCKNIIHLVITRFAPHNNALHYTTRDTHDDSLNIFGSFVVATKSRDDASGTNHFFLAKRKNKYENLLYQRVCAIVRFVDVVGEYGEQIYICERRRVYICVFVTLSFIVFQMKSEYVRQ